MAVKDIQYKYKNLTVVCENYIRGEVRKNDDCPDANNEYYIANIPEGAILQGYIAFAEESGATTPVTLSIGVNNCVVCTKDFSVSDDTATCGELCNCVILKDDAIVSLKFNNQLPEGRIIVLVKVIMPTRTCGCNIPMYDLCRVEVAVEPCLANDGCFDCGCDDNCTV